MYALQITLDAGDPSGITGGVLTISGSREFKEGPSVGAQGAEGGAEKAEGVMGGAEKVEGGDGGAAKAEGKPRTSRRGAFSFTRSLTLPPVSAVV